MALTVWRDRARHTLRASVGETAPEPALAQAAEPSPAGTEGTLRIVVSELGSAERSHLGIDYGVRVERIDNPGEDGSIQGGDVIVAVNGERFASIGEFEALLALQRPDEPMALFVRRGANSLYVARSQRRRS